MLTVAGKIVTMALVLLFMIKHYIVQYHYFMTKYIHTYELSRID